MYLRIMMKYLQMNIVYMECVVLRDIHKFLIRHRLYKIRDFVYMSILQKKHKHDRLVEECLVLIDKYKFRA